MLSELVEKVERLEKALMDHITVLTNSTQIATNQAITHQDSVNLEPADNRKQTYAETLVEGRVQNMAQHSTSGAAFPSSTTRVQASHQNQYQSQDYRVMVREELLELDERKKRRASLVIRGLGASSTTDAATRFAEVTEFLIGEKVALSETIRIKSNVDLFRGNVHNYRQRKLILEQARGLKNSPFAQVYIKRDLTYLQRMQLQARYQQNHPGTRDRRASSTVAPENTHSEAEPTPAATRVLRPHHSSERLPEQEGSSTQQPMPETPATQLTPRLDSEAATRDASDPAGKKTREAPITNHPQAEDPDHTPTSAEGPSGQTEPGN